ncbi:hypothetical protein PPSIR1_22706 [Plesiocystis pacifica SIR-1]|uniref:Uncharacterized protein n=2 Tax=Plesiocystis pacifica TaxID=191768 RepID=A6G2G4_9BACT|nr:hypothetical protein PPSIR1_22706 [Plesiocystis pacifica SIR-1]
MSVMERGRGHADAGGRAQADLDGWAALWLGLHRRLTRHRELVEALAREGAVESEDPRPPSADQRRVAEALLGLVSLSRTVAAQIERSRVDAAEPEASEDEALEELSLR